jgi:plasmid stability protein
MLLTADHPAVQTPQTAGHVVDMPAACQTGRMSNVQVKHLDDELHEQLRQRAAAEGKTISEYVLDLIRRDLRVPRRRQWLEQIAALPKYDFSRDEIAAAIDEGRRRA